MNGLSVLSTLVDPDAAIEEVLTRLRKAPGDSPAELGVAFASAGHAETLGRLGRRLRDTGLVGAFLGCTGESIVGERREVENGPALAVLTIRLPGAVLSPVRLVFEDGRFEGWNPNLAESANATMIVLGDPFTFPTDRFLSVVQEGGSGLRVVGGMASASRRPGDNRLVLNDEVFEEGAVALVLSGRFPIRTVVSQGCRPIGRAMIVTKIEKNVIRELGGRNSHEVLRETYDALEDSEKALVKNGLHIGRVINEYQETFHRGDFLVRNVLGVDESGGLVVTDLIRVGQTVQFHVRDAETADEDLRRLLESHQGETRGALLFTCNGRGTRMFPSPNHDIEAIHDCLGSVPVAGFFAMGEIGPVGGKNFVHGFTASVVLFEEPGTGEPPPAAPPSA